MGDPSHRSVSVSDDVDEAPARPWPCQATKPTIGSVGNIEAESPATELEASVTAFSSGSQMGCARSATHLHPEQVSRRWPSGGEGLHISTRHF
jgi:hypothetical protein